jgi:hypothetical protein
LSGFLNVEGRLAPIILRAGIVARLQQQADRGCSDARSLNDRALDD